MLHEIDSLGENRVLHSSEDELCGYLVEKYRIEPLRIDEAEIDVGTEDVQLDVSRRFNYGAYGSPYPVYVTGTRFIFHIPFSGDPGLFDVRPSSFGLNMPSADVRDGELAMAYEALPPDEPEVTARFRSELARIKQDLERIAEELAPFNASLYAKASQSVSVRRDKLLNDRRVIEQTGFKIRLEHDAPRTYVAPEVKRRAAPQHPPVGQISQQLEPTLGMADYEIILSIISNMGLEIERSPDAFSGMTEENLRQHFLVQLNGQYPGDATGETFNCRGKTDILIRVKGRNIFVAECKFWNGPKALAEAIDQLQNYTTWRDVKTALVVFNRETKMTTVLEGVQKAVKAHPNYRSEKEYDLETGFRYILGYPNDAERDVMLTVLVFDVPR